VVCEAVNFLKHTKYNQTRSEAKPESYLPNWSIIIDEDRRMDGDVALIPGGQWWVKKDCPFTQWLCWGSSWWRGNLSRPRYNWGRVSLLFLTVFTFPSFENTGLSLPTACRASRETFWKTARAGILEPGTVRASCKCSNHSAPAQRLEGMAPHDIAKFQRKVVWLKESPGWEVGSQPIEGNGPAWINCLCINFGS